MMNKSVLLSLAIITASSLLSSCTSEYDESEENKSLSVNAFIDDSSNATKISSRVAISSTSWSSNDAIGTFLRTSDGTAAYPNAKQNIQATWNGSTWSFASSVYLSATAGKVYAYYPYSSSATNYAAIPVAVGQTDYLWGVSSNNVTATSTQATIPMKHALALIQLHLVNSNSPNNCVLSKVQFKNTDSTTKPLSLSATMNCSTGAIASKTTAADYSYSISKNFKTTAQDVYVAVLPMTFTTGQLGFVFTIDGTDYPLQPTTKTYTAGMKYTYTATMQGNSLSLGKATVTVTPWGDGGNQNQTWN